MLEIPQGIASCAIWTTENLQKAALFIRDRCPDADLEQVELGAIAQIVEQTTGLLEDQSILSTCFRHLKHTIHEADY